MIKINWSYTVVPLRSVEIETSVGTSSMILSNTLNLSFLISVLLIEFICNLTFYKGNGDNLGESNLALILKLTRLPIGIYFKSGYVKVL